MLGYAQFVPDEENRAAEIAPDLCPPGKFGYDPRCRPWYNETKELYLRTGGTEAVHITTPYLFANKREVGLSAASPIANPRTGTFVGEALLDFDPVGLREALQNMKDLDAILIAVEADAFGGDTGTFIFWACWHSFEWL